jgi:hypothetical protein
MVLLFGVARLYMWPYSSSSIGRHNHYAENEIGQEGGTAVAGALAVNDTLRVLAFNSARRRRLPHDDVRALGTLRNA